jgi:hypothetical protein
VVASLSSDVQVIQNLKPPKKFTAVNRHVVAERAVEIIVQISGSCARYSTMFLNPVNFQCLPVLLYRPRIALRFGTDPVSNSTSALCDCNIRHRDQMRDVTPVRIEDWCNVRGIMEQRFQVRIA